MKTYQQHHQPHRHLFSGQGRDRLFAGAASGMILNSARVDSSDAPRRHDEQNASHNFSQGGTMRARFLGKDSNSQVDNSPTLFVTDRTDRRTYIAQGWKVTDPQALADVGPIPDHEAIIEIPEDVLKFYARSYSEEDR
ncbi:MAG: hypothetical protein WKF73_13415 [Nocardioidaceae bacterium]